MQTGLLCCSETKAEAVRLELTSLAAACFRDRVLIQPDDFRGINRPSSGGWNRTNDLLVQSQTPLPTAAAPEDANKTNAQQKTRHPATPGFSSLHEWLSAGVNKTNEADEVHSPRTRRTIDSVAENGRMKNKWPWPVILKANKRCVRCLQE